MINFFCISERERELERIHRRSRELIMNPRIPDPIDSGLGLRDGLGEVSPDRMSSFSSSSRIQRNHQDVSSHRSENIRAHWNASMDLNSSISLISSQVGFEPATLRPVSNVVKLFCGRGGEEEGKFENIV